MQTIGVIHHLASTGGTIVCKCLAAMEKVVLLSEIHPLVTSDFPVYLPMDPLSQLMTQYPQIPAPENILYDQFRERLSIVAELCRSTGRHLLIRDHSHSDYMTRRAPQQRLLDTLRPGYDLRSVVTVRHPIDSWLSMKASQFDIHVSSFSDYCQRYRRFLDDYHGKPLWKYEDFVIDPTEVTRAISAALGAPFDSTFVERFGSIRLTGDSGRRPSQVQPLPRRPLPEGLADDIASSTDYLAICDYLKYPAVVVPEYFVTQTDDQGTNLGSVSKTASPD